ncbi:MAG: DNA polymerase III subunit delta, partial [Alphaproteobacteria bacterium]|nr:DNA polymerase III subunit delta [Alphaproteobacteria bacterium]
MKIAARQIQPFLNGQAKGCKAVLIYGADEGQAREHASALAKAVGADPKDPFSFVEISEDQLKANPTLLHDELFAMSMMGGQRFVRLLADADGVAKTLEGIYNAKNATLPDAYLLVLAGELNARSGLRSLFEEHPQLAAL